jgi:sec-independent protein translocase protein TatC
MDRPQPFLEHLQELRRRIIIAVLAVVVCIGAAFAFAHRALIYILAAAKADGQVILVQNTFADTFLTEFHLALIGGLVLAFPIVLYQVIAFILPALRPRERRILYGGLPLATGLFVVGWLFGWTVVVPLTKAFFLSIARDAGVQNQITPSAFVSFVLSICNPLGIAFELPLVVLILARIGLVTSGFLRRTRRIAFLLILILAAVLSPPDVISLSIFFVPLYGLYELSIWIARLVEPRRQ